MMLRLFRVTLAAIIALAGVALAVGMLHQSVIPGLSSARQEAPAIEVAVATWLLRESVPTDDKARVNPLGLDAADVTAGQDLFRQKCEVCHGYDGGGKTESG
jgi:mono/diheme cytochrome c family protein